MKKIPGSYFVIGLLVFSAALATSAYSMGQDDAADRNESAAYAKQLSSLDPATRQIAAEALARLVALEQKKLVEGYVLQEKDKRVRLALNWALYRMGKSPLLIQIVRDLDSSRHEQAAGYLTQLESPTLLYPFLRQENISPKIMPRLLDVLGRIGDAETLDLIKPFHDSFDPKVSEAAQLSTNMIQHHLDETQPATKTRPRTIGKTDQP
jgi:HEAT repeat protein